MAKKETPAKTELTEFEYKALLLIQNNGKMSYSYLAHRLWPESTMHTKVSNQGNGATSGKAAWLVAGSYCAKLRKAGLIGYKHKEFGTRVSELGSRLMALYVERWGNTVKQSGGAD